VIVSKRIPENSRAIARREHGTCARLGIQMAKQDQQMLMAQKSHWSGSSPVSDHRFLGSQHGADQRGQHRRLRNPATSETVRYSVSRAGGNAIPNIRSSPTRHRSAWRCWAEARRPDQGEVWRKENDYIITGISLTSICAARQQLKSLHAPG